VPCQQILGFERLGGAQSKISPISQPASPPQPRTPMRLRRSAARWIPRPRRRASGLPLRPRRILRKCTLRYDARETFGQAQREIKTERHFGHAVRPTLQRTLNMCITRGTSTKVSLPSALYQLPIRCEQSAQFANSRKNLLVPISALTVASNLLHLDGLAILLEDPIREPRQHRPR
jgi:hypothetical protein